MPRIYAKLGVLTVYRKSQFSTI